MAKSLIISDISDVKVDKPKNFNLDDYLPDEAFGKPPVSQSYLQSDLVSDTEKAAAIAKFGGTPESISREDTKV